MAVKRALRTELGDGLLGGREGLRKDPGSIDSYILFWTSF